MIKKGFSVHCHHDILVEHCYDYDERVDAIKITKPKNEQEIRLKLFKLLPQEAIDELPTRLILATAERAKATAEWAKATAERDKAYAEWAKATAERDKATAERAKAYAEWAKATAEWDKAYQEKWHKKWCGCFEWQDGCINFK